MRNEVAENVTLPLQRLAAWETRERRKANEYGKEFEKEGDRRKEMVRAFSFCITHLV